MDVGVRELKAHLSEHLARVADGETVVVTDRGRPVARIVPFDTGGVVGRGIAEGWIEAPRRVGLDEVKRHKSTASAIEVLGDDRGDR